MPRFLLLLVFFPSVLFCQETFTGLSGTLASLSYSPDATQTWYFSDPPFKKGEPRREARAIEQFVRAGGFTQTFKLEDLTATVWLDPHGRAVGWEQVLTGGELIKVAGIDRSKVAIAQGQLRATSFLEGVQKNDKSVTFGDDDLDSQATSQTLQALLQSGKARSFRANLHVGGGTVVGAQLSLKVTPDPLSLDSKAEFPLAMKQELRKGRLYSVFILSLEFPTSLVFPHKFYFVYDNARNFAYSGYWGGAPDQQAFQVRLFSQEGQ